MSTVKNVEKAGRQFWLAGLGACIVSKEYAVKKMDELFEGTNTLVNGVLAKGATIEGDLKNKFQSGFQQDEKILELREKLGLNKETKQDKIARLAAKVDALTEIVATLSVKTEQAKKTAATQESDTQGAAAPASKPAAKRTTTRKPRTTTAESTSSTTAAKPAARRSTAKKTTTNSKTDTE